MKVMRGLLGGFALWNFGLTASGTTADPGLHFMAGLVFTVLTALATVLDRRPEPR